MSAYTMGEGERETGLWLKVFAIFAGVTIPAVLLIGLWLAVSAFQARDDARAAAASAQEAAAGTSMAGWRGWRGWRCRRLRARRRRRAPSPPRATPGSHRRTPMRSLRRTPRIPQRCRPAAPGAVANVRLDIRHATLSIAPGIRYDAWTFGGTAPGPVIHVRQGQTVNVTLHNSSPMPHSVDFHAAQIAPNVAFSDVFPG